MFKSKRVRPLKTPKAPKIPKPIPPIIEHKIYTLEELETTERYQATLAAFKTLYLNFYNRRKWRAFDLSLAYYEKDEFGDSVLTKSAVHYIVNKDCNLW